ncbi:MAG: FAD-dependent oxidoreductase, partial [Pseudomonadota bacterium]
MIGYDSASAAIMRLKRQGVRPIGQPVSFYFDRHEIEAFKGETIASALAAHGIATIRRDQTDKWRGVYCGMGACFECAVTIDGRLGQRACMSKVRGGEKVRSTLPSGKADDPVMPLANRPVGKALSEREVDILVIGAGPGGMSAAAAACHAGASVVVLDERSDSGGQYYKPIASSHEAAAPTDRQFRDGEALLARVRAAGVQCLNDVTVFGAFAKDEVLALVDGEAVVFHPQRLILATGALERPMPFPGWTLPGVMTTGALQTMVRSQQVMPGKRVVIAGNGPLNFQLAADLVSLGVDIAAVVESAACPSFKSWPTLSKALRSEPSNMIRGASYLLQLRRAGVPVLWSHMAIAAHGDQRVNAIDVAPIGPDGRLDSDQQKRLAGDVVGLGYGFIASSEIARALGCKMRWDERHLGSLAVDVSRVGATSVEGVFAVGDGAQVAGASVALAKGELAGMAAARELGFETNSRRFADAHRRLEKAFRFQDALWSLFQAPSVSLDHLSDETIICRCETLTLSKIQNAIKSGATSLAVLKRRLRLGMGRCQGRYCLPTVAHLLSKGASVTSRPAMAPRLPVKPFPASALALEKSEWGGHQRAGSPNLSRPTPAPSFDNIEAGVAVIGGGVVGACLAHELAASGEDVLVVERDDVNLQASGANAGSLHVQLLSFDFGDKAEAGGGPAAATLPLGPWAVSLWQELAEQCGKDFEIRITGGLMIAENETGLDFLQKKAALERRYGLDTEIIGRRDLQDLAPALADTLVGAAYAPSEGKINPLVATYSVMRRAERLGARLLRSTDVIALEQDNGLWHLRTNRGVIKAGRMVNAAGPWARQIGAMAGLDVPVYSAPLQMIVTDYAPPLVE